MFRVECYQHTKNCLLQPQVRSEGDLEVRKEGATEGTDSGELSGLRRPDSAAPGKKNEVGADWRLEIRLEK